MKVVVLNNNIVWGGALKAAINTHKSYLKVGTDSHFLNYIKSGNNKERLYSISKHYLDRLPLRFYKNRVFPTTFSAANVGINLKKFHQIKNADIINLHWITGGFISLKSLKWLINIGKPIVWTIHDFWPITGGCHVNRGCERFFDSCGQCPLLGSQKNSDLSRKGWSNKKNIYSAKNMHIITVSKWMSRQVRKSSLMKDFNIDIIPNPIDTEIFKPNNPEYSREKLGLSKDNFLILFGGMGVNADPNKGLENFKSALNILSQNPNIQNDRLEVLIFGNDAKDINTNNIPFKTKLIGKIDNDELLASYYSASNVFVCSSWQETGPITILESISCGTTIVAFPVGEVPEIINHKKDGYITTKFIPEELAIGLEWCYKLTKSEEAGISKILRNKVLNSCSFDVVGNSYRNLFKALLVENPGRI